MGELNFLICFVIHGPLACMHTAVDAASVQPKGLLADRLAGLLAETRAAQAFWFWFQSNTNCGTTEKEVMLTQLLRTFFKCVAESGDVPVYEPQDERERRHMGNFSHLS